MFCRKCGFKLPDDSYFCSKCGANLQNNTSQGDDSIETSFSKDDVKISVEDRVSYIREHFGDIPNYEEDYSLKVNNPQKWYLPFHTFKELNNMSGRSTRKDFNICDVYFWLSYGVIRILHIIGREATKEYVRYKDYSSYSGYYYNYKYEYNYGKTIGSQIAIGLSVIFMLYLAYRLFIVTIRRVHDLGISGKRFVIVNLLSNLLWFAESAPPFAVIGAIALIGWGIPLYWKIIFFRGEQKGNKYGVDPLKYIPEIKILTTKELLFGNTFAKVNRISKDEFALTYTVRLLPFICVYLLIHNCFSFIFSIIPLQYFDFLIYSLLYFPLLYPLFYFVLCVDIEFRRIQDFGKSGWWLLFIIPILLIINFILFRLFNLFLFKLF